MYKSLLSISCFLKKRIISRWPVAYFVQASFASLSVLSLVDVEKYIDLFSTVLLTDSVIGNATPEKYVIYNSIEYTNSITCASYVNPSWIKDNQRYYKSEYTNITSWVEIEAIKLVGGTHLYTCIGLTNESRYFIKHIKVYAGELYIESILHPECQELMLKCHQKQFPNACICYTIP